MDDPDVAKATTKIQAGFRGMKARKEVVNIKEDEEVCQILIECMEADQAAADIDLGDPEVERATTMIQAGYRGMQARKDVKSKRKEEEAVSESEGASEEESGSGESESESEEESISEKENTKEELPDLQDPDVAAATTKIQAGYRGMMTRKDLAEKKRGVIHQDSSEVLAELLDNRAVLPEEPHSSEILADLLEGKDSQVGGTDADATELEEDEESSENEESSSEEEESGDDSSATTKVENAVEEELPELKKQEMEKAAREQVDKKKKEESVSAESESESEEESSENEKEEEDEKLPDLEDEDVAQATMKIQAGYRGMRARKEVREKRKEISEAHEGEGEEGGEEEEMPDLGDPDVAKATTKIQAGYRGMKARKRVGDMKAA